MIKNICSNDMNIIAKKSITNNEFRDFNFLLFKFLFSDVIFIFYYVTPSRETTKPKCHDQHGSRLRF